MSMVPIFSPVLLHRLTSVNDGERRPMAQQTAGREEAHRGCLVSPVMGAGAYCVWRGRESRNVALAATACSFLVAVNHSSVRPVVRLLGSVSRPSRASRQSWRRAGRSTHSRTGGRGLPGARETARCSVDQSVELRPADKMAA